MLLLPALHWHCINVWGRAKNDLAVNSGGFSGVSGRAASWSHLHENIWIGNGSPGQCTAVSGNARSPGQSTSWSRGVGSNYLFQQQLLLKLSQNNHAITVMPTLLWYLLWWSFEHQHRRVLLGWTPSRDRWQKPAKSFTFLQGLNLACKAHVACLNLQL